MPGSSITLYGLATCDTTRAARKWLDAAGVVYRFHDVRADGLKAVQVRAWIASLGWEKALNKASTTWRSLPDGEKLNVDAKRATDLILAHPTLLKRPILDAGDHPVAGFKADAYARIFAE